MWKGDPKVNFFKKTWNNYSHIEILGRHLKKSDDNMLCTNFPVHVHFFGGFSFLSGLFLFFCNPLWET